MSSGWAPPQSPPCWTRLPAPMMCPGSALGPVVESRQALPLPSLSPLGLCPSSNTGYAALLCSFWPWTGELGTKGEQRAGCTRVSQGAGWAWGTHLLPSRTLTWRIEAVLQGAGLQAVSGLGRCTWGSTLLLATPLGKLTCGIQPALLLGFLLGAGCLL